MVYTTSYQYLGAIVLKYKGSIRNKKAEEYVFISQIVFLLLVGILFVRVRHNTSFLFNSLYINIILLLIPAVAVIIIKILQKKMSLGDQKRADTVFNLFYLALTLYFLNYESESFFKILLLMPIVICSLQYGARSGYFWAFLSSTGLFFLEMINKPVRVDEDVIVIGVLWLFAWLLGNMTEAEKEIREELQYQAALDGLTGIYNHRSFYDFLDKYLDNAKFENDSLALIMIDVDFFKYYNDTYGHRKGDEVLRLLAQIIDKVARNKGLSARYGGDEFAVILPKCSGKDGLEVGEMVRQEVEKLKFEGADILPHGKITISVGVATFPENANTKEKLVQKADEALYKAKYTSTNSVELYYSVFEEIKNSLQDKEKELLSSMRTLLMVVNAKDRYTYGHCERVMHYAVQIGRTMSLWEWEIQNLTVGALLHDIGKIEVSREVLNKTGKLTEEEWFAIRQHPVWGADMIRPISSLSDAVDIVQYHHENFDGTGYPYRIKGEEIPLGARILRVADSFDAMTSNRPYKRIFTFQEALEEIQAHSGTCYDPEVVEAFTEYLVGTGILSNTA